MRTYKKYYNREMPLLCVEYWYKGERHGLPRLTRDSGYFNPLFIYKKGEATSVYYDITDFKADNEVFIQYFKKHPEEFKILANEYEKECRELLRLTRRAEPRNFSKIFNLHLSTWPKLVIMMILGKARKRGLGNIARRAYSLREKTAKIEYLSGDNLTGLAERILPNFDDLVYFLTLKEITNKSIPKKEELEKREKGYIYFEGKIYTEQSIGEFEKLKNIKILRTEQKDKKLVKGTAAMQGKARGRVRVIFEVEQLDKVKNGDILVTPMTTPDYIQAMKKAAAFVTDEGGLTCHAAIVAREMKKPCIIGTKNATGVLKDGDLVNVDAEKGIVKISNKK